MAMTSPGARVVPEIPSELMGGLNLSIIPDDCEDTGYRAWSVDEKADQPPSLHAILSSAVSKAAYEHKPRKIDPISDFPSSSASPRKGKLSVVIEGSESLSRSSVGEGSSSSSSLSIASSSASSTNALFRRGDKHRHKHRKRGDGKKVSVVEVLLWPLKKLRDGYMSCMMGLEGAGDLSGLAQGSTFATSAKYFGNMPGSKSDAKNYG